MDPAVFCEKALSFKPTKYQLEIIQLFLDYQFVAARWSRQSGKSYIVAALLLWYALANPGCWIGIVAPGLRQAKYIIRKINNFLQRMSEGQYLCPRRMQTIVHLSNGSVIEAFPNNPETIRGPSLNVVYWDEMNITPGDKDLYDAVLFTLGATGGKFVCSSTPWNKDSMFYKIFHHKAFNGFAKSHVTWQQALEPNGPLTQGILEQLKEQYAEDPWAWHREMDAEWSEDEKSCLSQDLITRCIATVNTLGYEIELWKSDEPHKGRLLAGLDLGKHKDYSVLSVVDQVDDKYLLRYMKVFELETPYASIIGFVKALQDRWGGFEKIRVDMSGVGEYIVEDMQNAGMENVEGVVFTAQRKQEMYSLMKERMRTGLFWYPYFEFRVGNYQSSISAELHVEKFDYLKDGSLKLNHPEGTNDDVFWSIALALYCSVKMSPEPFVTVIPNV